MCKDEYGDECVKYLLPFIWLALGILTSLVTLLWLVHIGVYMIPPTPPTTFLNAYFQALDTTVISFFGTISIAVFCLYMLVASVYGVFKLGLRLFIFTVHPMKYGDTLMNTFLVNVG